MIEIVAVKEARYKSVDEVHIDKNKVIRNKKYCKYIEKAYKEVRKEFYEQWKASLEEHETSDWKKMVLVFDKNFMNVFLSIWKESVFEKSKNFSKDELGPEEEKRLMEESLENGKIQEEVKKFFLENIPTIKTIIKQSKNS